jgi:hypothetical protein
MPRFATVRVGFGLLVLLGVLGVPAREVAADLDGGMGHGHGWVRGGWRGHEHGYGQPEARAGWYTRHGMPYGSRATRYSRYGWGGWGDCADACGDGWRSPCGCGSRYRITYGASWAVMRRYLSPALPPAGHYHYRSWWIRRWPYRSGAHPGWGSYLCSGTDLNEGSCPFSKAALATDSVVASAEDRLLRGLERFRLGRNDLADAEFRAVLESNPSEPRAEYGRLMVAYVRKDFSAAARALGRLAALGELDARDRLEDEDGAGALARLLPIADALENQAKWDFTDADLQLVSAWILAATGQPERARPHLVAARRFRPDDAAATKMLADLDGKTPALEMPADRPAVPTPSGPTRDSLGAPPLATTPAR